MRPPLATAKLFVALSCWSMSPPVACEVAQDQVDEADAGDAGGLGGAGGCGERSELEGQERRCVIHVGSFSLGCGGRPLGAGLPRPVAAGRHGYGPPGLAVGHLGGRRSGCQRSTGSGSSAASGWVNTHRYSGPGTTWLPKAQTRPRPSMWIMPSPPHRRVASLKAIWSAVAGPISSSVQ